MSRRSERAIARIVAVRAGGRCEYCRMHESLQGATFHVEHIVPRSRGGQTRLSNLAWCCPGCNLAKASRMDAVDPTTVQRVRLFHPRRDVWAVHFEWSGYLLSGQTPKARATIAAFDLNHERRLRIRRAEEMFGLFPP